ncbi:uncharacterized protein [Argopecten irradians]|uniref:uncharacterized protein n=1 Tax=Argopecten irradians TaxID=31199 RepID=UPI003712A987
MNDKTSTTDETDSVISRSLRELLTLVGKLDLRLNVIEEQVKKIDGVQKSLNSLTTRVRFLEDEIHKVKDKHIEIEKSAEMISDLYDDMKDSTLKTNSEIKSMKKTVEMVDSNTKQIETVVMTNKDNQQAILDTIEDIQCRSMKQNLVFHGLREDKHEDTESRLKDFIYYELCIEKNIEFTNVHRFGRHVFGKSRPIVAVFMYQKDLQLVRKNAHYLKDTNFWINEQFPKAVEQRRRELYPILRSHKRAGHQVKLVRDRLYIDNQLYDGQETPSRSCSIIQC